MKSARCAAGIAAMAGGALALPFAAAIDAAAAAADEVEVRAYVNDSCIIADEPFFLPDGTAASETAARSVTLLGIVVGKITETLITHAVKATAKRVSSRGARKDTRYAVAHHANLYRARLKPRPVLELNARLGCMTIVAGRFQSDDVQCLEHYLPRTITRETMSLPRDQWQSSRTDESLENLLRRANVCMDGKPRAVYEARFEFSPDATAYRLVDAGHRVDTLLTTTRPKAVRNVFYTLEITQPAGGGQPEPLTMAMVDLGRLTVGGPASEMEGAEDSPWLRVPPLSTEARRVYEQQTHAHQEVAAEIAALERAITRGRRLIVGLEARTKGASPKVVAGLREEQLKGEVQILKLEAELDTRRSEYTELPDRTLELMPVSIEIGVTESTSEKPAVLALARVMEGSSGMIGAATSGYIVARSLDASQGMEVPAAAQSEIEAARAAYFDARLEADREAGDTDTQALTQSRLTAAKLRYNTARSALGLETLP